MACLHRIFCGFGEMLHRTWWIMAEGVAQNRRNAPSLARGLRWYMPFLCMTALCMTAASCSSVSEITPLVDSGKYQYHNCEQLSAAKKAMIAKRDDLKGLIDKAERGTGGALVGTVVYRSDYAQTLQELTVIDATARTKDCLTTATWRSNAEIH